MANKTPKPRTNWTTKQRRVTGVIGTIVIVLLILLCVKQCGPKADKTPTAVVSTTPVATASPSATSASTASASTASTSAASTSAASTSAASSTTPAASTTASSVDSAPASSSATSSTVVVAETPVVAVAESAVESEKTEAVVVEEPAQVEISVATTESKTVETEKTEIVVETEPAKVEEAVVEAEPAKRNTYAFDVYGYGISGSYAEGSFDSHADQKGVVYARDIEAFAAYENAKYGALLSSVIIDINEDGFELSFPAVVDAADYIDDYQADIYEFINQFVIPAIATNEEAVGDVEVAADDVEVVVEVNKSYSFDVYGYGVYGEYCDGGFESYSETKGFLVSEDIQGFAEYEIVKYGSFLTDNVFIQIVDDGFILTIPEGIDAGEYIEQYRNDIIEFVQSLLAPVQEETKTEEIAVAPVVEEPASKEYSFDVYGFEISGSYAPQYFDSSADPNEVIVSAEDIMGFAGYENGKYGNLLADVIIEASENNFKLSYPAGIDAGLYIEQYRADLLEYLGTMLAVAPEEVEAIVEEAVKAYAFEVFGYTVAGEYCDGYFDSYSETKDLLTAEDIWGFVAYENAKYGTMLADNVIIDVVADGFVLTIPEDVDAADYIEQYRADIIEYVTGLFAVVEEPAPVEVVAAEEPASVEVVVVEEPAPAETVEVVEEPAPVVPAPVETVEVVVLTDGAEKPAKEASSVAEKVKYNDFKLKTSISGGMLASLENNGLGAKFLNGKMSVEAQNVIQLGNRVGLGARFDGGLGIRPWTVGWSSVKDSFIDPRSWNFAVSGSAKLMLYGNFNKATMYAGAGFGYSITRNASYNHTHTKDVQILGLNLKSGMFIDATVGMSLDLSEHFGVGLDLGYRYFLGAPAQETNVAVVLSYTF